MILHSILAIRQGSIQLVTTILKTAIHWIPHDVLQGVAIIAVRINNKLAILPISKMQAVNAYKKVARDHFKQSKANYFISNHSTC